MTTDHLQIVRQGDPAAHITDGPLDRRGREDLRQILSGTTVTPVRPPVARRSLLVGVAAVSAGAVGVVVLDPFGAAQPAAAATPPMIAGLLGSGKPATAALSQLANQAVSIAEPPGNESGLHMVRTESWELSTRIDGKQVRSAVVPEITELAWSADRSGHITTRTGRPYFPNSQYQSAWKNDGSPGRQGTVVRSQTWQAGGYAPMFPNLPLPSDPGRLLAALTAAHPIDELGTGELAIAIRDLYNESQPGPQVRANLLRLLADRPDVVSLGRLTDRAGRPAECFAVDSTLTGLPQRQLVMFSPTTGSLLAMEEVLTQDSGRLGVRIPSVVSYRLYYPVG
jgi:hypothetical protein